MVQKNFLESWLDLQKQVFDFYQESMKPQPKIKEEEKGSDIFTASLKSFQVFTQKWLEISNELLTQSFKYWEENCAQPELVKKVFNGADLYQNLNKFWTDLSSNITGKDSDPVRFCDRWNEEYRKIVGDTIISFLPEQVQNLYKEAQDVCSMSTVSANNIFKPWLDEAQKLQYLLQNSMGGDQEAYIEFYKVWKESFSATFGKILNMPEFSMNRENVQMQMQVVNALIKLLNTMNEFWATMVKVNQETFYKIVNSYQDMLISGTHPKTFKEFYKYWLKQNEEAYLKLFGTSEFSRLLAQVLDAGLNFKKGFDNLLEKQLEFLPYPTKTDMDSVYKTLDTLKRDVRTLKKEVAALK